MTDLRQEIEAFCGCENDCDFIEKDETVGIRTAKDGNSLVELTEYLIRCGFTDINKILGDIQIKDSESRQKNEIWFVDGSY